MKSGHRGSAALQRMVEYAPSTGGLALWITHHDAPAGPPLRTDGRALYYGPGFEELPLALQTGLVAHQVLHVALRHVQRLERLRRLLGEVDRQLFNICADAIVDSTLAHVEWLQLPDSAVFLEQVLAAAFGIRQSAEKSLLEWDLEKLYRAVDDRRIAAGPDARGRRGRGGGPVIDDDGAPGAPAPAPCDGPRAAEVRALGRDSGDLVPGDVEDSPEAEADAVRTWSERILRAHTGDGAHSMLRTLLADVPRSHVPWPRVLRSFAARALAPQLELSWSRPARSYIANQGRAGPHRRAPWTPGLRWSRQVLRLALIVDVSGSIGAALLQTFTREIEAIAARADAALLLVIGDDRVHRIERFEVGAAHLGRIDCNGGGGTDFTPLIEEADRHAPDAGVILTDLDGPARFRPRWPVLWAVPEDAAACVPPFGRKLILR